MCGFLPPPPRLVGPGVCLRIIAKFLSQQCSPPHPPLSWWGQDCCPWQVFEWQESREVLPQASRNRGQAPHTSVIWAHSPATGPPPTDIKTTPPGSPTPRSSQRTQYEASAIQGCSFGRYLDTGAPRAQTGSQAGVP